MKLMKRVTALMLCGVLLCGGFVNAFATENTDSDPAEETTGVVETTVPVETTAPVETSEAVATETTETETVPAESEPTESEPAAQTEGPQVGDKIWIRTGSYVYKSMEEKNGWPLLGNYKVEIVNIYNDENGEPMWYEFEFTSLGIGEWLLRDYKYVKAENTSVEEPEPSEPSESTVPSEPDEPEEIEEIDESVYAVSFAGDNNLAFEVASAEVAHALLAAPESSSRHHISWRGVYDITADAGTEVTITGLPEIGTKIIEIRHYLDSADAVSAAIASGDAHYLSVTGSEEHFADEIAAMKAVVTDAADDEICYVVLSSESDEVTIMDDNSISFYADSYSYYEIGVVYVSPTAFTNAAPFDKTPVVENEGVETSKSVVYDEETDTYTLILESYVTGSTTTITATSTKATDFVISLDTSHSMDECINCGGADTDSVSTGAVGKYTRCPIYAPDLDINATYYRGTSSGNPVVYCAECKGWFASTHWKEDGSHGSIDDVRYLPWESASSKDKTIARIGNVTFYEDHICTEECEADCALAGTRVPVYSTDPGFSTDKTYFRDANTSHTAVTYVCTYCDICEKWFSNYHCSGGTVRDPATYKFYENHECTEECAEDCELAGTRVLVDTSSPDFSTEKEYYTDNNVSHTAAKYVIKYCSMCERWISNTHGHSASTGTQRIPYERGTYGNTVYDLFHVPCISLLNGAKDAIEAFIDQVYEMSKGPDGIAGTEDDVHHRVALTGFSGTPANGRVDIDYRPYKGSDNTVNSSGNSTWSRSGIFSVWNSDIEESQKWYPYITDCNGSIEQQNFVSYDNIDSG